MEQAEIFRIVAIVSFAVSGLCLLLAAVSWFKLGIPEVIGDITGRTARKQIEEYEAKQEGRKERTRRKGGAAKSVRTAGRTSPLTGKPAPAGRTGTFPGTGSASISLEDMDGTEILREEPDTGTEILAEEPDAETEILTDGTDTQTEILEDGEQYPDTRREG